MNSLDSWHFLSSAHWGATIVLVLVVKRATKLYMPFYALVRSQDNYAWVKSRSGLKRTFSAIPTILPTPYR
jgi:hypothetical protein